MGLDTRAIIEIVLLAVGIFFGWQGKAFYDRRFIGKNGMTKKQLKKMNKNSVGGGGGL